MNAPWNRHIWCLAHCFLEPTSLEIYPQEPVTVLPTYFVLTSNKFGHWWKLGPASFIVTYALQDSCNTDPPDLIAPDHHEDRDTGTVGPDGLWDFGGISCQPPLPEDSQEHVR